MVKKVEKWQAKDGTLHQSEKAAKRHEATGEHECPKCKGLGRVNGKPKYASVLGEEATSYGGFFAHPVYKTIVSGYEQVPCDLCRGEGWTQHEKKPITETKVVGWE